MQSLLSSEEFDTGSPTCRGKSGCLTLNRSIVRHHFKLRRRLSLDSCSRMDMGIGTGMGIGMGGADTVSWLLGLKLFVCVELLIGSWL